MSDREQTFAALLAVSSLLVVAGVAWLSVALGLIVSGVLLAGWSWLLLAGADEPGTAEVLADNADELPVE